MGFYLFLVRAHVLDQMTALGRCRSLLRWTPRHYACCELLYGSEYVGLAPFHSWL